MAQASVGVPPGQQAIRIRIRCDGSTILVKADEAFIAPGYSVVWDADVRANEKVEIVFPERTPFAERTYKRLGSGPIFSGPSQADKGDFKYEVRILAYDGTRNRDGYLNDPRLVARVDPMIKI